MAERETFSGQVRQALVELGPATVKMVCGHLDIPAADYAGRERVRQALRDLADYGLAAKLPGQGRESRYAATAKSGVRGETQAKIWCAVCLKGQRQETFTRKDLAVLTGANDDYLKRYLRFLQKGGWIEEAGKVRLGRTGTGIAYRQVREKYQDNAPRWNRRAEEAARKDAKAQNTDGLRVLRSKTHQALGILQEMQAEIRGMLEGSDE